MMDLTQKVDGIVLTKRFEVREDEDSTEVKKLTARITFSGTLQGVFHKAMSPVVIAYQGKVRKHWSRYRDGQTVEISFTAPTVEDPESAMVSKLSAMSEDERKAYIAELLAKL